MLFLSFCCFSLHMSCIFFINRGPFSIFLLYLSNCLFLLNFMLFSLNFIITSLHILHIVFVIKWFASCCLGHSIIACLPFGITGINWVNYICFIPTWIKSTCPAATDRRYAIHVNITTKTSINCTIVSKIWCSLHW